MNSRSYDGNAMLDRDDLIARELNATVDQGFAALRASWTNEQLDPDEVLRVVLALIAEVREREADVREDSQRELLDNRIAELERWIFLCAPSRLVLQEQNRS